MLKINEDHYTNGQGAITRAAAINRNDKVINRLLGKPKMTVNDMREAARKLQDNRLFEQGLGRLANLPALARQHFHAADQYGHQLDALERDITARDEV